MELTDIARAINEWLENKLSLPFKITNDIIANAENDGCCLRYNSTPYAEKRFIDTSHDTTYSLAYYFRMKDAKKCRDTALQALQALDGARIGGLDIVAQTAPQFVEKTDKGATVYTATIMATCHYKGEIVL